MDLQKAIQELYEEKVKIDEVIASLEAYLGANRGVVRRRGRKSMGSDERLEVSQRMKKYWASRRVTIPAMPAEGKL